jgi:hypothetical protein
MGVSKNTLQSGTGRQLGSTPRSFIPGEILEPNPSEAGKYCPRTGCAMRASL